ncbi:MAG: hypothetical protein GY842_04050 [bacterium]|nr:hypothetical protein [bacterium]
MSASSWRACSLALAITVICVGCDGQNKRLNVPPQGFTGSPCQLQEFYTPMVENALRYDMCLAEIHFYPHSAKINGLGEWRLEQYCQTLADEGGTLHLETPHPDDELTAKRLENISDFFLASGFESGAVEVAVGLPQGRPLDGADAVRILQEGTVNDLESTSSD